jgi:hypothetical protein
MKSRIRAVAALVVGIVAFLEPWVCRAQESKPPEKEDLKPLLKIQWRLGPDYPMGIQDSAVGLVRGKLVSAGGFTRHPLDIVKRFPDAFGGDPSGFTRLAFALDPKNESAGWQRIADMPGTPRQGAAVATVDDSLYAIGGMSYAAPFAYRDTYRLTEKDGQWTWEELKTCQTPWEVYGASAGTAVIGKKVYLLGVADFFPGTPGADNDFHSESGRGGSPVGRALLVLDTENLAAGWRRLADCPGVPKFDAAVAAVGGKVYQLGGIFAPLAKKDMPYYNAVDSWRYDPATDQWTRLPDVPHGTNRRALVYADRYILLVAGYKYAKTWNLDGTQTDVYTPEEKTRPWKDFFENTVLVYDTVTGQLGTADSLAEKTSFPGAAIAGDVVYTLGGEGGPRLWHPATLQIGKISQP